MNAPKLWRGQTLQDRSIDRREQMLEVGEALLGEGGSAAVTMRAVIREANLSPRYFYETFTSREDLLIAVYDRVEARLFGRMQGVQLDRGLRSAVRTVFERCGDYFDEDPRRARILLREPLADATLHEHRAHRAPEFIRALLPMLGAEAGGLAPADDDDLVVVATALTGALTALYLDYAGGKLPIERDRLAETAVDIVFAFARLGGHDN